MPRKPAAPKPPKAPAAKPAKEPFNFASAGRYTTINEDGTVNQNAAALTRISAMRHHKSKTAGLFSDGELGPANIADSNNIGYYSYQFPVDALEMPASRAEELEFYRLAYTRDPIVTRAIDLHTELPLSKMKLEKPKCSVESFADYVFDFYQRLMNDTRLFAEIIQATREYHAIGEAFLFVEQPEEFLKLEVCEATATALKRGRGFQAGISPMSEAENKPIVGQEKEILPDFIQARHKASSLKMKRASQALEAELADIGEEFKTDQDIDGTHKAILSHKVKLAKLKRKLAAPGDPPAGGPPDAAPDAGGAPPGDEGAPPDAEGGEEGGMEGGDPMDGGGMDFGGGGGGGGFGGGGGGGSIPADMADDAQNAVTTVEDAARDREINQLKRYIHLLERKKDLLEEFHDLAEQKALENEIFSHVVNEKYDGFDRIQILQPERVSISKDPDGEPIISYKPEQTEKDNYLADHDVPKAIKDKLAETGIIEMNRSPFAGSYVIHFARKKSGYELHGRSALQSTMRAIIYREKLRQVQTTLASRNMTPKVLITAPGVSEVQIAQLRAHADEAIADPDYCIVCNYEVTWNQIDSQSRLLNLADEWSHTNANLAIGLGFSPEILIGEGLYGGNRIQLDLLNITYTQFREELSDLIENSLFKPIAMLKGFFESDKYGRPRWIYPKISFTTTALRESGDVYEMLFNLFSRGSLPVDTIYEFLGLDSETVKRSLETDLFTVADSKFGELVSSLYGALGGEMISKTDIIKRITNSMNLNAEEPPSDDIEGSGAGM